MKKALVFEGIVIQVEDDGAVFPVHASLSWIEIPSGVSPAAGWRWDGSAFSAPVEVIDWPVKAQDALDKSDVTVLRCVEAGVALPPAWADYRRDLRAIIVGANPGPLPTRPAYPAGT